MLTIGRLNDLASIRHGFFTRLGGVSEGLFTSLNCGYGSGDRPEHVTENRRRAMEMMELDGHRLVTAYQVHSPDVVEVRTPWAREDAPQADAMVTRERGLALGILTADCVPVLFADAEAGVVGAAHAGWKGALTGVAEATVAAMVDLGATAERIVVGIGPAICQRSYEVGPEFPAPFLDQDPLNADYFCPARREGHSHFDIKGYVATRLAAAGVKSIQTLPCDTCAEEDRFFSYRRACHRREPDYGRGLSAIYLET